MPKDIIRPEAGTQTTRANNANLSNGSTSSRGNNYVPTQRTTTSGTAAVSHEAQLKQMQQTVDTLSRKREWKSSSSSQSQTVQLPQYDNSKSTPTASLNTNMGMLTYIDKLNQTDADAANNLYSGLKAQWSNYNSPYSRPYADITNKSKQILNELGIDTSNINDEWYNQYDGYMNYLPRSTYTNEFSTPTKRQLRDPNVMIGYAVYQFHLAEEQTAQAESEYAELQKEINYLANDPRNFSNEEIKRRLNIAGNSKFKTLAKMDEGRVGKKPIELNRAINYNGEDDLDTLIWQARNGGPSGNYLRDMINAGYGNGNVWKEDPELAARQQSSPYAAGMVGLDDAGMYFGRYSFDLKWLQENEGLKDSNNPDDVKMYQKVHEGYLNAQAAKEDLAKLEKWLTSRLKNATDPQAVLDKIPWSKYPTLNKMVLSLGTDSLPGNGKYVNTTEAIDFSYDALKRRIEQACAENAEKGDLESFSTALEDRIKDPVTGEDIVASTTLDAIDSNPEGVEEQRQKDDEYIKEYAKDYDETHGPGSFQRDFGNLPGSGVVSGGGGAPEDAAERQAEYEAAYNAKYGPNAYEEDKAADIAAMENGTYTGPRHPPLTDEEKKLYAAQDAKLQDGADLVDEISTENEKHVFNTTGFSQFDTGKKMVDGYRNFVMGNNRAQRNFVRSLGEDEVKIHAKDTLDNYKTMYDYDTKKDEVSSWKLQYDNLSKELGDKAYAGKQIEDFRDPLIETAAGTFRLQLEFQMDDQGRGSYAPVGVEWMDDVDPDKARAMGISPNTLADTEQGRNLIAQYSYEANGIMSYQQNPVELTEEDEEALQQLRALELNIADGEAYLANNRLEAEAATKGFDEAQKHRESIIYLMRKEGLDTSKLEQVDQMLEYLTGFSDYERTVWSAYNPSESYHVAMMMGADPKAVLEAAGKANAETEAELKKAQEAKAYLESNGIHIPQNYIDNLNRHIDKLQKNIEDYKYFQYTQNDDFEKIAAEGEAKEQASRDAYWENRRLNLTQNTVQSFNGLAERSALFKDVTGTDLTDTEKKTYYYLLEKEGGKAAERYFDTLTRMSDGVLHKRFTDALTAGTRNMVKDGVGGFLGTNALAVVASPLAAMASLGYMGYSMVTGEEINPNNVMLFANNFRNTTREESARSIEEACGGNVVAKELVQGFYEMVTNRLDSMANMAVFGGLASGISNSMLSELVSASPMGISAAMDAMAEAKRNGASDGQAWGLGLVTMIMETGTEAVSIENIKDAFGKGGNPASTMKEMIKDWLTKSGVSEMAGETLTDFVEDKADELIMGEDSDFAELVWKYRMQGIDDKDMAEAYARRDQLLKYARTALISYLSPGLDTFSFAAGRADYYREKAHSEQLRGNRDATTWSEYKKAREARKAEAKNADTTLAEGNGPLNMGAVDEMLERREARDAAADLEQNGRANGEGALDLSSLPPAPQTEAPAAEAPAPAPEQAEAPAPEFSAKDNADKAMTDYGLLEEAKSANADSQASTIASFLGDGNPDNDMVSNAAASRINEVFSDPINEMGDLMIGASAGGVDVSLVKQAITNAIVGGERSLARQTMQSQEYQNANPEGKAILLADTVKSDSLDRDVGSATYKAVREWRIAQKEADMIKAGALDNLHSAEQEADTARRNLDDAQAQLEERQGEVAAAQEALQAASYAVTEDPGNADNVNAVTQAVTNLENASKVEQEYEQRVQNLEAKQKQAEETANRLKESAMADLRQQAAAAVAQEDQQIAERAAAEAQAKAEQEAAEAKAKERQAIVEEETNNAAVADADGLIEQLRKEFPDLTEEEENYIRERFENVRKEMPVPETHRDENGQPTEEARQAFLKFKEQVSRKFGVDIFIPENAADDKEFNRIDAPNGYFDREHNRIVLNPNASTTDMMTFVLAHELTHLAEKAGNYKQLASSLLRIFYGPDADYQTVIDNLKKNNGKGTNKLESDLMEIWKKRYDKYENRDVGYEYALQEMVADHMGILFNPKDADKRQDLINRLVAEEPSTARQILNSIKRAIKQMLGMKGAWLDYSQQTVEMFEQALKDAQGKAKQSNANINDTIKALGWTVKEGLSEAFEDYGLEDYVYDQDGHRLGYIVGNQIYSDSKKDNQTLLAAGFIRDDKSYSYVGNNAQTAPVESVKAIAKDGQGNALATELRGGTVALNTDVKRSLNSWTEDEQERVRKALIDSKRFTPQQVDDYLRNTNGLAAMIAADKTRLDFQANPAQKFLKPNNDYHFTLDASTLCAKRLLYQGTFDYVQHALPDEVFTPTDLIDLVNIMNQMGYETPCGICYVESRRRWLDTYAHEFLEKTLKDPDAFIEKRFKKSTEEEKAALRERLVGELPSIEDLTTSDGLERLRTEDPLMHKAFVAAMNAKGTANPKVVQLRTEYRGDIGDLTAKDIQKVKDIGGLRIQSFSDFETPHLLDMVQAVLDMSSVGLTSQAYTKVPNFAWVFGDTGIKINLSLIGKGTGLDENGNLVFDNREGMNFDEAMRLRDRYSKNVGTILVGINDDHIIAAMADPRIDFIIPFHKSGWSDTELKGIPSLNNYKDYTDSQNEKKLFGKDENGNWIRNSDGSYKTIPGKDSKLKNFEPVGAHKYWEFDKNGEWNARKYLKMCAEDGRIPKFSQFLVDNGDGSFSLPEGDDKRSTAIREGYWKTLIDFKMYDNDGAGADQQAVTPNINMDQAERVLNEHKLGRQMPDKSDGTPGKFIPVESNNDVPVAIPAAEEYISLIKQRRAGKKPTGPNDTLKATPGIDVMKLGRTNQFAGDTASQTGATAAMASGAATELGNTQSENEAYAPDNQAAMAIDPETGDSIRIKRSLPVTDPEILSFLNRQEENGEVITTYRTMKLLDGKLVSPKASLINGKVEGDTQLGQWEAAAEHPELVKFDKKNGNPYFTLDEKGRKTDARYNPYMHSSNLMLNDQFSGAYQYSGNDKTLGKFVTVECIVPKSEETSGYKAQYAKDPVGWTDWKAGGVAQQVEKAGKEKRNVFLSRWIKPVRIVPDSEVAQHYKRLLDGTDIEIPANVVTPSLLDELEKAGVKIGPPQKQQERKYQEATGKRYSLPSDAPYMAAVERGEMDDAQRMVDEKAEEAFSQSKVRASDGKLLKVYHGTKAEFNEFQRDKIGSTGRFEGSGFNFTPYEGRASSYGGNVLAGYLNIEHPLSAEKKTISIPKLAQIIRETDPTGDNIISNYARDTRDYGSDSFVRREAYTVARVIWEYADSDVDIYSDISSADPDAEGLIASFSALGYDGLIHYDDNGNIKTAVAFSSEQFKKADTVTYDDNGNIIPLSERFNTQNPDIRYSLPSDSYLDQRIHEYLQNGGVLSTRPPAPSPAPRQRQFGSQTAQRENTMTLHDQVRQYLREHSEYDPDTNRAQVDRALEWVQGHANGIDTDGYFGAVNDVTSPDFDYRSADGQARMLTVMCMASMKDDTSTELRLADAYNQQGTDLGRMLQARKLFQMMTPIGRQQVLQKQVDKINEEQKKKGKKPVKLSDEIIHEAGEAKTKEQFDQVRKKAAKELAEQLPPDWKEKLVAWRMLAMLGNVRTHVRNFLGNAIFMPVVGMKNKIGAVGEILTHQKTRTKTLGLADQQARAFAKADAKTMEGILRGDAKYNDGDQVQQERKVFKTKALQWMVDKNSQALEAEDWIFLQRHYRNALAGYMTANKLSAANMTGATLEAARTYAIQEAQKATYRDANAIATWLNKAQKEHPAAGFVVNAVLPFKKTPANILKRGVEYSPVGLLNAVIRGSKQVRTGQITANQLIDKFCAGLTGTGIMVMGAIFASLGAVHAGLDDDDDEFEKLQGEQEYSINPGRLLNRMFGVQIFGEDATFTIDWAAPVCMPFFTGAAIFDARSREEGKNLDIAHVLDSIMGITEPVFNLSMLDGVNSLLDVNQYGEGNAITQIGEKIVTNYATSYIPSALGQLARTVDTTRRKAYVESGADLSNFRYALEQSENKIPWLSKRNIPYRNVWGEADVSGRAEAAIENFISPGYGNRLKNDPVVTELERLYRETGNPNMIPKSAGKTVSVDGETIKLNAEQYDQYVVDRGTTARQVIEDLMESPLWQVCDDDTRADLVTDAWSYANQIARHRLDQRGKLDGWVISADTNGNATQAIIDRAVDKNKKDYISGHGQSMAEALYSGDYETYETSLQALEDAEATKSQVKGALRDYFKPLYQSAYVNGDQNTMSEIEDMLISSDGDFDMDDFDGWIYRNEDDEEEDASIYQWLNLDNR